MADEPTVRGWLPPHAPGGQPPPRFEPAPEQQERAPDESAAQQAVGQSEEHEPQPRAEWLPPTADPGPGVGAERAGSADWGAPGVGAEPAGSADWRAPGSPPVPLGGRPARYWGPPPAPPVPPDSPPAPNAAGSTLAGAPAPARAGALAITAVVLGSLGLALLLLSLGTSFLLSLPCSAIGWACGAKARRRADADPAAGRRGTAQTGVVLGMLGVGLGVVAAITWIVLISAGITIDDLRDYLERKLREQRRDAGLLAGLRATLGVWLGR